MKHATALLSSLTVAVLDLLVLERLPHAPRACFPAAYCPSKVRVLVVEREVELQKMRTQTTAAISSALGSVGEPTHVSGVPSRRLTVSTTS